MLHPLPPIVHFLFGCHAFVESSLALSHTLLTLFDASPSFFEEYIFLLLLDALAFLSLVYARQLFRLSLHVKLVILEIFLKLLLLFFFYLLSLKHILFKLRSIVVFYFLKFKVQFLIDFVREILHVDLQI